MNDCTANSSDESPGLQGEPGQAQVEAAFTLPLVPFCVLGAVQLFLLLAESGYTEDLGSTHGDTRWETTPFTARREDRAFSTPRSDCWVGQALQLMSLEEGHR